MIRRLKTLTVALAPVFAMSAMVASAGSAHPQFTSSNPTTTKIEKEGGNGVIEVTGLALNCASMVFTGHMTGSSATSITLKPAYTGCTAKLGVFNVNATVTGSATPAAATATTSSTRPAHSTSSARRAK